MAPKRTATSHDESSPKILKKVMNLEKVKLLDKCRAGNMSHSAVRKLFNINESTVRSIDKNEANIRAALASTASPSAKKVSRVISSAISMMESTFYMWITDQNKKGNPIYSNAIRAKGKVLYDRVTSDKASTCAEASTSAKVSNGAEPDRLATTLLATPSSQARALKGRNKNLLSVFWIHNVKAWTTNTITIDWFHHCLLTEVRAYLQEKGLPNKILLVDNTSGHPVSLDGMCDDVEVVFKPPNTNSLIQSLDQGVIAAFKAYYTRRCM
ncbi:uncharacterized protein LOC143025666 [Oratosquilla oratoria]|uniref:uncharacterized protein LOC143025666 n=1 Tax=Oratosquilla oratoria TaxID=337810 RepID=UPI003F775D80